MTRTYCVKTLCLALLTLPVFAHAQDNNDFGVMIMAHGGGETWNKGVLDTVAPLREHYPVEVAFGMADAVSLQEAVAKLESQGVDRIAVVKLFIGGESWHERTRQILGIDEGAPTRAEATAQHANASESHDHQEHANAAAAAHTEHSDTAALEHEHHPMVEEGGHSMEFWRLDSAAQFSLSAEGLAEAAESAEVMLDRARVLSKNPANEDVLILAHGTGTEEENARWLAYMDERAAPLRSGLGFHAVKVATLREDWPEKREAAKQEIRDFVVAAKAEGRTAIVIPFRVHGFGPYAEVLEGLDYVADETGLIPHPAIGRWIERQVEELR